MAGKERPGAAIPFLNLLVIKTDPALNYRLNHIPGELDQRVGAGRRRGCGLISRGVWVAAGGRGAAKIYGVLVC